MMDTLGPTEQYVVDDFKSTVENLRDLYSDSLEHLNKINLDNLEEKLSDPNNKESIIKCLEGMKGVTRNISMTMLLYVMAEAILMNPGEK